MTTSRRCAALVRVAITAAIGCGNGEDIAQTGGADDTTIAGASTSSGEATTGVASDESSESSTDASTGFAPDLPPYPTACEEPQALIAVTSSTTPLGPMTIDEAWLELDVCGSGPYVVLAQTPTLEMPEGVMVTIAIEADDLPHDPFFGVYPARTWGDGSHATGTIEVLEPFALPDEVGVPRPDTHLHARIDIHTGGYDLSVEVDVIDCGTADCYCPCR